MKNANRDSKTVEGFGDEWERFDQSNLDLDEQEALFEKYFSIFPWKGLPLAAQGFDMGCGSGRWAKLAAQRVGTLHCIDPSAAIDVARRNLAEIPNCVFHAAGVEDEVLPDNSMDFGYSLGVLHHIPDTARGLRDCVRMLKPGAPFLLYLYYALDNRSLPYRMMWQASDLLRRVISLLPHGPRFLVSQLIATFVYFPLARFAAFMERLGMSPKKAAALPLGFYRNLSFYTMRTDALDRFGTRLEQRFTRQEIYHLMQLAGLSNIRFSESDPYWCAIGFKS
ncbi:MAG: class I SAM-dependent methyltransferase [bacterium]